MRCQRARRKRKISLFIPIGIISAITIPIILFAYPAIHSLLECPNSLPHPLEHLPVISQLHKYVSLIQHIPTSQTCIIPIGMFGHIQHIQMSFSIISPTVESLHNHKTNFETSQYLPKHSSQQIIVDTTRYLLAHLQSTPLRSHHIPLQIQITTTGYFYYKQVIW